MLPLQGMNVPRLVALAPNLRLETERLVLRRLVETDAPAAIAHEQDRAIMRWIRDLQPLEDIRARFRTLLQPWCGADAEWLALAVTIKNSDAMIGVVVCRVTVAANETMEIGYRLQSDVHRRGYCLEACRRLSGFLFDEIEVRKLVAYCVEDNEPSWRLMEKLGMQREALFREYTHLDGQWRNECVYGLLARDWKAAATRETAVRRSP
jgi:[ribosomal protein S5]-alanine N-acetyltransferase